MYGRLCNLCVVILRSRQGRILLTRGLDVHTRLPLSLLRFLVTWFRVDPYWERPVAILENYPVSREMSPIVFSPILTVSSPQEMIFYFRSIALAVAIINGRQHDESRGSCHFRWNINGGLNDGALWL